MEKRNRGTLVFATVAAFRLAAQPPPGPPPAPPPPPSIPTWVASSPEGAPPTFEVASVRPAAGSPSFIRPSAGRVTATSVTMEMLISWAWDARDFRILNQPAWFHRDKFDITARAYRAPDTAHLKLLMRRLLADRFRLAVHDETRQMPGYALRVEAKGHKLKPSAGPVAPGSPSLSGNINARQSRLVGDHASMADLARDLSRRLGASVRDETGLSGMYDFKLEWVPDGNEIGRMMMVAGPAPPEVDSFGVSLMGALKSELGLRLDSLKAAGFVLLVDHCERVPVGN